MNVLDTQNLNILKICVFTAALSLLPCQTTKADEFKDRIWVQGAGGIGYQQLLINSVYETPKNGYSLAGSALAEYRDDQYGALGIALGMRQTSQQGATNVRSQTYVMQSMTLGLSYFYPIVGQNIWVGAILDNSMSTGALFDFSTSDQFQILTSIGPQVRLTFPFKYWDWVAGGQILYALNAPSRTIWQVPVFVGISFKLFSPSAPDARAPSSTAPAIVEDPTKVKVNLDSTMVQFEVNSTKLTTISKQYLSRLAKALLTYKASWKSIAISGHTDASGNSKKNLVLSRGRAKAVREWLIHEGLPADALTAEGRGFEFLLPGFALNAPEHRRVELALEGVSDKGELQGAIDGAKEPKKGNSP